MCDLSAKDFANFCVCDLSAKSFVRIFMCDISVIFLTRFIRARFFFDTFDANSVPVLCCSASLEKELAIFREDSSSTKNQGGEDKENQEIIHDKANLKSRMGNVTSSMSKRMTGKMESLSDGGMMSPFKDNSSPFAAYNVWRRSHAAGD